MNSWRGTNIYTENSTRWIELINSSTSEFMVNYLPPNVIAIPGKLDDVTQNNITIPPDFLVIQNAGKLPFKSLEGVIFGVTSGIALILGLIWLIYHWWRKSLLNPKQSSDSAEDDPSSTTPSGTTVVGSGNNIYFALNSKGTSAEKFKADLETYYAYIPNLELYQRNIKNDGVAVEDVEAGTELLRRRYECQLQLISNQGTHQDTMENREKLDENVYYLTKDYEQLVGSWLSGGGVGQNLAGWSNEEIEELRQIWQIIQSRKGSEEAGTPLSV
ncbi:hypothetical protein QBC38DRAFT_254419 [Podospora fimiseda]|uniref:Uncharacterized protein n=1 Tax=Podospora fimiseda TaxID=252190 RepID=A0AAN7BL90_9PEZI|nr:hypothetical protein QBC38DRAFT_254419 [Podospora fimiseda]